MLHGALDPGPRSRAKPRIHCINNNTCQNLPNAQMDNPKIGACAQCNEAGHAQRDKSTAGQWDHCLRPSIMRRHPNSQAKDDDQTRKRQPNGEQQRVPETWRPPPPPHLRANPCVAFYYYRAANKNHIDCIGLRSRHNLDARGPRSHVSWPYRSQRVVLVFSHPLSSRYQHKCVLASPLDPALVSALLA